MWVENITGCSSLIIEFRNRHGEVGKEAGIAKHVVARLIFTPPNAKRVVNNAACWLDTVLQHTTIDPGEVRRLVIVTDLNSENCVFTLYNPRKMLPNYFAHASRRERVAPIEPLELSAIPCKVELILVSENRTLFSETYEFRRYEKVMQLLPVR